MTAYAAFAANALFRYPFGQIHQAATQVNNDGDVIQLNDGRVGIVSGVGAGADAVAVGDPLTLCTNGVYQPASASATLFTVGQKVYWDPVAFAAVTNPGGANAAYYAGVAVPPGVAGNGVTSTTVAKASGATSVWVDINVVPPTGSIPATVAAAGTNQATAAAIPVDASFVLVSGGNNAVGVVLNAGCTVKLKNGANSPLFVYPPVGAAINALGLNAALNMSVSQSCAEFVAYNAIQFYTVPSVPS